MGLGTRWFVCCPGWKKLDGTAAEASTHKGSAAAVVGTARARARLVAAPMPRSAAAHGGREHERKNLDLV